MTINHNNIDRENRITYFDSNILTPEEKKRFHNASYNFFAHYLNKSEEEIKNFTENFIKKGVSINFLGDKLRISQSLGQLFIENPIECVNYMNSIVSQNVKFIYRNGSIEVVNGGGPGGPTQMIIKITQFAANDFLYKKVA